LARTKSIIPIKIYWGIYWSYLLELFTIEIPQEVQEIPQEVQEIPIEDSLQTILILITAQTIF